MKKIIVTVLFSLILIGIAPDVFALDMEFHTYGGFDAISIAFKKLALISSDNGYKALFFSVIAMGILFGGAAAYFNLLKGGRGGVFAWMWPIAIGSVLYLGLMMPKGNITVYDPVMNKFETIGNVPNAIVVLAGTLNTIERGIVDIIDTSGTPSSYKDYGFSLGFDTLLKAVRGRPSFGDTFLDASMHKYEADCLFFALQIAGSSGLTHRQLSNESTDFFTEYAKAQNPAVFTVVYDETDPGGRTESCKAAWTHLQTELSTPSKLTKLKKYACSRAGYNVNDETQLQKCSDVLESFFGVTTGVEGLPSATYLRQVYMAQSLENTIRSIDPDFSISVLSSRGLIEKGVSTGMIVNEWIPIMKAVITAVAIGLIPILVIFLPTPLASKTIGAGAGLFIWITMWGVTDAIVASIGYEYSLRGFEIVKQNNLGLAAIMYTPGVALKAVSMAGMCRGSSALLATVMTGAIVKFGGHAFTHMMGGMTGAISSQAAMGAGKTMEPQQAAKELEGLRVAPTTMANLYKFDPSTQQKAESAEKTSRAAGLIDHYNKELAAWDAHRASVMAEQSKSTARGTEIEDQGLDTVLGAEKTGVQAKIGDAAGEQEAAGEAGMDVQSAHELTKGIGRSGDIGKAKEIGSHEEASAMGAGSVKQEWRRLEDHLVKDGGIMSLLDYIHAKRKGDEIALTDAQVEKYNEKYGTDFKGGGLYSLAIDSDGNPALAKAARGTEDTSLDRTQDLGQDTYSRGVKIDGADGIMEITPTAARARAEQGDLLTASMLSEGSEEQVRRNTLQQAKSMAEYLEKFASDKHVDLGAVIGKVFAEGGVKSGWGTPGLVKAFLGADAGIGGRIGVGVEGKETSQRTKEINYLATGLYQAMDKAGKEGGHKGILMGQDKLKAAEEFSSKIENEVLNTQPLFETPAPVMDKAGEIINSVTDGEVPGWGINPDVPPLPDDKTQSTYRGNIENLMGNLPGEDESANDRNKKDETPKAPGGSMGTR